MGKAYAIISKDNTKRKVWRMVFHNEIGEIYRLKVPFDGDVYTSVFLIKNPNGHILIDCATTAQDVDEYIQPALMQAGLSFTDISYLFLTHCHSDHAGGKSRVLERNPKIKIVDFFGGKIENGATMYAMKGHTLDCVGLFDPHTGTLVCGDGLQGYGVGKYRCTLESAEEYQKTIDRIHNDKCVQNLLFSHAYEPWYKDGAFGREEVEKCLQACIEYINKEIKE